MVVPLVLPLDELPGVLEAPGVVVLLPVPVLLELPVPEVPPVPGVPVPDVPPAAPPVPVPAPVLPVVPPVPDVVSLGLVVELLELLVPAPGLVLGVLGVVVDELDEDGVVSDFCLLQAAMEAASIPATKIAATGFRTDREVWVDFIKILRFES